ncbi:MAG: hypothetical protein EBT48_02120 [Verrucomicrobia bacterium]|nr:hypothetical protein [Verrucomicrobiota bacterium]
MSLSLDLVPYGGWAKAIRMRRDGWELVAPLEIGPRILRFGPVDGPNILFENKEQMGKTGAKEWMIYGGHRLWTAPENDQCYALDNDRVSFELLPEKGCRLTGEKNEKFGWQKSIEILWNPDGLVQIEHRLMNPSGKPLPVSPWCLTVLNQGGVALIPQPAYVPHPIDLPKGTKFSMDDYLPNRNLTLWKYTDLADPRIHLGRNLWTLSQMKNTKAFKIGFRHTEGWIGYQLGDLFFAKWISHEKKATYPDRGCNTELFTNGDILEIESLAPEKPVATKSHSIHFEWWHIAKVKFTQNDEASILKHIAALPRPTE